MPLFQNRYCFHEITQNWLSFFFNFTDIGTFAVISNNCFDTTFYSLHFIVLERHKYSNGNFFQKKIKDLILFYNGCITKVCVVRLKHKKTSPICMFLFCLLFTTQVNQFVILIVVLMTWMRAYPFLNLIL